jgi:hypothetical protein
MSVRFQSPELSEADDFYLVLERYVTQHARLSRHAKLHHYRNYASFEFLEAMVYGHPNGVILWSIGKPIC